MVTFEEQILAEDLPQSIVIAGAGAIGVEFAYVLHNYGVQVTIVELLDRIAPLEDADVSAELVKQYRKLGIDVLTSTRVESIDESGPQVRVTVTGKDGAQQVLEADKVLQAIGFAPNVTGYGLENTGVRVTERGAIDVDARCRTCVPHIYAIGDVTAKLMLAGTAAAAAPSPSIRKNSVQPSVARNPSHAACTRMSFISTPGMGTPIEPTRGSSPKREKDAIGEVSDSP